MSAQDKGAGPQMEIGSETRQGWEINMHGDPIALIYGETRAEREEMVSEIIRRYNSHASLQAQVEKLEADNAALSEREKVLREALEQLLTDVRNLIAESHGVIGLHLNGDVAYWDELMPSGRFERLVGMTTADAALSPGEAK